jgi:hypothetical protein
LQEFDRNFTGISYKLNVFLIVGMRNSSEIPMSILNAHFGHRYTNREHRDRERERKQNAPFVTAETLRQQKAEYQARQFAQNAARAHAGGGWGGFNGTDPFSKRHNGGSGNGGSSGNGNGGNGNTNSTFNATSSSTGGQAQSRSSTNEFTNSNCQPKPVSTVNEMILEQEIQREVRYISRINSPKRKRKETLKLYSQWHPDKNPENSTFATKMFQLIQTSLNP